MMFEQAALQEFPTLTNSITRKQINTVVAKYGVRYPNHIANPNNNISRGVFNFSTDLSVTTDLSDNSSTVVESDAELDARIRETYSNLELVVKSVAQEKITSLILSGAAGVGKSYLVKQVLESTPDCSYTFVRGYVKPTGIFKLLWENRFSNQCIIFDDSDSVLEDVVGLNLLKAALELSKTRTICWMSEKEFVAEDGTVIPSSFEYEGQIIFLTNIDFHDLVQKGNKLSPHLAALESRSLYMDLKIRTNREKMMRIKQVVSESSILEDRGIYDDETAELMEFLMSNVDKLREVSLRTVEKLAALYLASPVKWKSLANSMMFK